MFKLVVLCIFIFKVESFAIDCTCGQGSYHALVIETVYSCHVVNLNITASHKLVTNVLRKHEIKMTNSDVRLLKIHNQSCFEIPEKLGLFFTKLEGLEVINSQLEKVKPESLRDFKNLKYINLMKNKIEVLYNETFQHNTKLQFVVICCNKLKVIGIIIFDHLHHLKHVDFRRNVCLSKKSENNEELHSLTKEIGNKCPPSIEVYCTFAEQDFPGAKFYTCEVRFWIVVIDYMSVEDFQGRHDSGHKNCNVHALRVPEMTTKYLPINLCKHFPKLEAIEVVGGRMTRLERRDLKSYRHLKILWLPRNNIETLSSDVFEGTLKLERISLYENRLKFIEVDVFTPLKNLKFVSLELNECIDRFATTKICIVSIGKEIAESCQLRLN